MGLKRAYSCFLVLLYTHFWIIVTGYPRKIDLELTTQNCETKSQFY